MAIANDTLYGLAGQVASGDDSRALAVALKIHSGTVGANVASTFSLTSPLGGVRQSGLGRRYGDHGSVCFATWTGWRACGSPS
jgi:aldehyde dehydrogenase (NAD+)